MSWKKIDLFGGKGISRLCGEYQITEPSKLPSAQFRIKVWERDIGDFLAVTNVCLKDAQGSPDWVAGLGGSESEALEDCLRSFMEQLRGRAVVSEDDFEWSDPLDF